MIKFTHSDPQVFKLACVSLQSFNDSTGIKNYFAKIKHQFDWYPSLQFSWKWNYSMGIQTVWSYVPTTQDLSLFRPS